MELDSLLSTSTLREITLIKLLNQRYPNWISKEEISSQLYISNRTLKSTVIVINSFFKEKNYEQYIETDAALGYKLSASTNAISNLIYLERLKSSTSFNLLLSIYNKKFISSKHFTDYYFISLTSFYKDVRTINLILDKFGIQFNSREGTLSGESSQIRYFFCKFFWFSYGMSEWPFQQVDEGETMEMSKKIGAHINPYLSPIQTRQLAFALSVCLNDLNTKKFIEPTFKTLESDNLLYQEIQATIHQKYYFFKQNILKHEVNFIYSFIVSNPIFIQTEKMFSFIKTSFQEKDSANFAYSNQLLTELVNNSSHLMTVNFLDKQNFLAHILCLNFQMDTFHDTHKYIEDLQLDELKQLNPDLFNGYLLIFSAIEKQGIYPTYPIETRSYRLKAYFFFLFSLSDSAVEINQISIQVLSDKSIYRKILKNELIKNIPYTIDFTDNNDQNNGPDIVVTDTPTFFNPLDIPIFHISFPPTSNEWLELNSLVEQEIQKKRTLQNFRPFN